MGKVPIPPIMRRTPEDRAGPVFHQHEVRDPHRHRPRRVERVLHTQGGVEPPLLRRLDRRLARPQRRALRNERRRRLVLRRHRPGDRMLRRHRDETHPEQRIRPRREHLDLGDTRHLATNDREPQPRPLAPPHPVRLHRPHPLRPARQLTQLRQQLLGIVRDPHRPLIQPPLLHRRARPPALAVDHLLVRQHGSVHRVPIDPALPPRHQPGPVQIQEQLLLPPVIGRLARRDLPRPVERQPHPLQLRPHRLDVGPRPRRRMHPPVPRRILRRQPECVPPHRMQHGKPPRPLIPRNHVAQRIVAHMAYVNLPARIREHLQHVVFRLPVGGHIVHVEASARRPCRLPPRLGRPEVIHLIAHNLFLAPELCAQA